MDYRARIPMTDAVETLKRHSQMLGRIGAWVSDFCEDDEATVEEAVIELLARYRALESEEAYRRLDEIRKARTNQ
jgi:hypothetical protein